MFRITAPAPRALFATSVFALLAAQAFAQGTPAPSGTTAPGVSRRIRASRQARIQRNIEDSYTHQWEIAGGGGFLRFRTGQYLQKISEINFFTSAAYGLSPKWWAVADVRGMYGNANIPNVYAQNAIYSPQISQYTFTVGPQYRFYAKEKYSISGSATAGVALSKFGGDAKGLRSQDLGMWPDSNAKPVFSVSVIGDYNIYNNFAFRVQPTYLGTTFGDTVQNNLGVELGLVYRFGRQK